MLNKILLNNKNIIIENLNTPLELSGSQELIIFNHELTKLVINAKEKANIIINDFRIINKENTKIEITAQSNAKVIYNHAFINENNYNLDIKTDFLGTNAKLEINIHGVNEKSESTIKVDGHVKKDKNNNELIENIRIINLDKGKTKVLPNLLINNKEVIANHFVTIGKIDDDELNYLMSKGINEEAAKKLIINGFLINIINHKELSIKIKEILNGR